MKASIREDNFRGVPRKNKVICIGGANIDQKIRLEEEFLPGTSNPVTSSRTLGGVIRNVASNLAQLGAQVSLMTILGQDRAGDEIFEDSLQSMDLRPIERVSEHSTGTYTAVLSLTGELVGGFVDMAISRLMNRDWIERHVDHLRQNDWLVADCNMLPDAMERLIRLTREDQKKLAIITISEPKMKHLPQELTGVTLVVTNVSESRAFFHSLSDDPKELVRLWLDTGVEQVVITRGEKPVTFGSKEGIDQQDTIKLTKEEIVDVTGAGDAFSAAVIYSLIQGYSLDEAVTLGSRLAALTIQSEESVRRDITFARLEDLE